MHSDDRLRRYKTTSLKIFCLVKILHNHLNNAKLDIRGKKILTTFGEGRERGRKNDSGYKRNRYCRPFTTMEGLLEGALSCKKNEYLLFLFRKTFITAPACIHAYWGSGFYHSFYLVHVRHRLSFLHCVLWRYDPSTQLRNHCNIFISIISSYHSPQFKYKNFHILTCMLFSENQVNCSADKTEVSQGFLIFQNAIRTSKLEKCLK